MKANILMILFVVFFLTNCSKKYDPLEANKDDLKNSLLLSRYRPQSLYKTPETKIDFPKYPVIDVHAHAYRWVKSEQDLIRWVRNMDSLNIKKTIILSYATGSKFDSVYTFFSKYPEHFDVWCGFDYSDYDKPGYGPKAVAELERCFKMGAKGVGELGDKGNGLFYSEPGPPAIGMHIDDSRMDPLLEKCAELGMPINIHVAEPIWMYAPMDSTNDGLFNAFSWRRDNKKDEMDHSELLLTLENAVKKHPNTTFIACHYANCSHDLNYLGRLFDTFPNLYADISGRFAEVAPIPRFVKSFMEKYNDRLLYGTDMGFDINMYRMTFRILESADEHFYATERYGYHWAINGFNLNDETLQKMYSKNIYKILSKTSEIRKEIK